MTPRQWVLSFVVSVALVALLMPIVLALADGDGNSAWVKIENGEKQANLSVDDVLGDGRIVDGKCLMPDMSMGIGRGFTSMRVGLDADTCQIVVKELIATEDADSTTSAQGMGGTSLSGGNVERR